MLIIAALCGGAFAFTMTLWLTGFGTVSVQATERLTRLRQAETNMPQAARGVGLRKRGSVRFGGINLISGNLAAQWLVNLERAGLALNVREYLALRATVGAVFALMVFVLSPIPEVGIVGFPIGFFLVGFWLKRRIGSRQRKLESQLIEMLQMLASGLRAGFGMVQALEASAEQLPAPISVEVRRTLRDIAMGSSFEAAFTALNERTGSSDFDIVITAILIQRSVGGNLAEILDNVAHTMRERERIRGEIRTLTAQQRLTGYVIGGIPFGLGAAFMVISPEFTSLLFTDPLGRMMLGAGLVMELIGFFVISKIVNIEV
ncbi:MAG: secretion system protein [Anaerolinea sp.]|nr:secretion system protein [Anaerolinea sp.]